MSCKTYRPMLHSYINDELNELEKITVSKHVEACSDCSKEAEEIKKLKTALAAVKVDKIQISGLKENIMSAIRVTQKVRAAAYDIKVLSRLGTSMIACGILVFFINFSAFGNNLDTHGDRLSFELKEIGQKIAQPMTVINKGLTDMSSKIVELNGITFKLEQKIRGGM